MWRKWFLHDYQLRSGCWRRPHATYLPTGFGDKPCSVNRRLEHQMSVTMITAACATSSVCGAENFKRMYPAPRTWSSLGSRSRKANVSGSGMENHKSSIASKRRLATYRILASSDGPNNGTGSAYDGAYLFSSLDIAHSSVFLEGTASYILCSE